MSGNIHEEHTRLRTFLQRLGSTYEYQHPVLEDDGRVYQPVRMVSRPIPVVPVASPEPVSTNNPPSALAFAPRGATSAAVAVSTARPAIEPGKAPAVVIKKKYRRIFSYYGSKSKIAHLYPAPKHDVIVEPFAGSAAYSALYCDRQVCINEKDPMTASVWKFLLRPDAMECVDRWFPKDLKKGDNVTDLFPADADRGLINYLRADIAPGSFGADQYCKIVTDWGSNNAGQIRPRLEFWIPLIRHWRLTSLDYQDVPNRLATWFIDPPYDNAAGSIYRTSGLNYHTLAQWAMARDGQVMVCENEGATWMPFRFLTKRAGSFTGRDEMAAASGGEVIWEKDVDPPAPVVVATSALAFALRETQSDAAPDPITAFVADLTARGHRLLTRDGKLFVSEASRLTPEDRAAIAEHRPALLALATPWPEERPTPLAPSTSLAQFLGTSTPVIEWTPDEPPDLTGIDEIVLNFATTGIDWAHGHRPIGVTVSTLDGQMTRFLPFGFAGGNLDEAVVKRWAERELRGKKITNSKTKFDIHHAREWGIDLEAQGCTFSDIQHTAALLDDHRKRFGLDVLAADYFPGESFASRVDESRHHEYHAADVAAREKVTAQLVGRLRAAMDPEIDAQELRAVQDLEDAVIPAVIEMERNGSPLDEALLEQFGRECCAAHDDLMLEIIRECGFAFEHTASGWKRLIESLHLPVPDSFSESVLNEVDHPLIRKGQRAAQYASLNSKVLKAYPEHIVDGIMRYDINQLASDDGGAVSGRFSIGLVQQVPNADNHQAAFGDQWFPRRLFVPGTGQYLEADAAQIEFRLLVHYSQNASLLQAYRDDPWMSFHKKMQGMLQAYKPDMLYAHTKSYNFAAQYGAKSIKLAVMMGFITAREGDEIRAAKRWNDPKLRLIKEIEAAYHRAHPEAGALLDRASHLAKSKCDEYCKPGDALHRQYPHRGFVKTLLGRRSRFPTNYKTYIGLNRVLQGTGASIMKQKIVELHRERKTTGFVMRITNHDAVLGDATTPETLGIVREMLNAQSFPLRVPILWSCGVGHSWAETHA